ncbi:hypothetical protein [Actinomadura darangshiensis]|uniref:hypothetical protein n=1 Tax=Actinomadura darangshiensis TaxID=705336 RepID=UPI00140970BB|nr:hypothetical protein [Actinomadura darangshiensis]
MGVGLLFFGGRGFVFRRREVVIGFRSGRLDVIGRAVGLVIRYPGCVLRRG